MEQAIIPMGMVKATDVYMGISNRELNFQESLMWIVRKIQQRWRKQMDMFHARIQLFMAHWHKFCLAIITKEVKRKSKKYSELIPLIKEYYKRDNKLFIYPLNSAQIKFFAREYVQEKMTSFLRELREFENRKVKKFPLRISSYLLTVGSWKFRWRFWNGCREA